MADQDDGSGTRLPLFPLPDVVHFPRTDLRIHVFESRYRRLVRDLVAQEDEASRWLGTVLVKPAQDRIGGRHGERPGALPEIYPGGTVARLVDFEPLPEGGANILLHGEYRFALERELQPAPYRQGLVRPIEEPLVNESDAGVVAVKSGLVDLASELAGELGERFPVDADEISEIADGPFEEVVNRIAAELDLPAPRKFSLLAESLLDRALSLVSILRSRKQVIGMLRPYRPLAKQPDWN
jgi:Lon protease-like protein